MVSLSLSFSLSLSLDKDAVNTAFVASSSYILTQMQHSNFKGLQLNSFPIRHKDIYNSLVEIVQWGKKNLSRGGCEWFEIHNDIKKEEKIIRKKEENTW